MAWLTSHSPLDDQSRRLERGWEYVTFYADERVMRTMEYMRSDDNEHQENY